MDKKSLTEDGFTQMSSSEKGHHRKFLVFTVCVMMVFAGLAGYFFGGAMRNCTGTAENVDGAETDVTEWSNSIDTSSDDRAVADIEMNILPKVGDCVCTTSHGVVLLQEAELSSGIIALLKKDQCFQLIRSLEWKADGLVFYRLRNIGTNQTGWAVSSHFRISEACRMSHVEDGNVGRDLEFAGGMVSAQCLRCICQLESRCKPLGCRMDVGSLSCGYFQIKNTYWIDCGRPGRDLLSCGKDKYCSSLCVQRYMKRYVPRSHCPATCQTFAREHNGGPNGCHSTSTLSYWRRLISLPGCSNPSIYTYK